MASRYPRQVKLEPGIKSEPGVPGVRVKLEPVSTPSPAEFSVHGEPSKSMHTVQVKVEEDAAAGLCSTFCAAAKPARVASKSDPPTRKRVRRGSKNDVKTETSVDVKLESQCTAPLPAWARYKEPPSAGSEDDEPYPKLKGPSPEECARAVAAMAAVYGLPSAKRPVPTQRPDLLDSLVGTILSQNTTDVNSRRAFKSLKEALPTWRDVLDADPATIIAAIRSGGLAEIKTGRVLTILQTLVDEGHVNDDQPSLDYLWDLPTAKVKAEIVRFNGVGPKTAACVLMFAMRRPEFPVDTHVWKIALKMGWVPPAATRETSYEHLVRRVPAELRFDLHCLLVEHGKREKNNLGCLSQVKSKAAGTTKSR